MEHKYSTYFLFGIIGVAVMVVLVSGIEGTGNQNSLAKFLGNDLIGNSSITDDGNSVNISVPVYVQGSLVGTSSNIFQDLYINNSLYIGGDIIKLTGTEVGGSFMWSNRQVQLFPPIYANMTQINLGTGTQGCPDTSQLATIYTLFYYAPTNTTYRSYSGTTASTIYDTDTYDIRLAWSPVINATGYLIDFAESDCGVNPFTSSENYLEVGSGTTSIDIDDTLVPTGQGFSLIYTTYDTRSSGRFVIDGGTANNPIEFVGKVNVSADSSGQSSIYAGQGIFNSVSTVNMFMSGAMFALNFNSQVPTAGAGMAYNVNVHGKANGWSLANLEGDNLYHSFDWWLESKTIGQMKTYFGNGTMALQTDKEMIELEKISSSTGNATNTFATFNRTNILLNADTNTNGTLMENSSRVCTATNGICSGGSVSFGNGIQNSTYNVDLFSTDSMFNSPYLGYGCYENWLLQSEAFATSWKTYRGMLPVSDSALSPIGSNIAENLVGNLSNTMTYQEVVNNTQNNFTFSVWIRTRDGANNYATVGLEVSTNNASFPVTETNFTVDHHWRRYNVTSSLNYGHTQKNVSIINGFYNISVWGAQLERGLIPSPYGPTRTTTSNLVKTCSLNSKMNFYTAGTITGSSGSFSGVTVGGALSTVTNIATTGTYTSTLASVLNNFNLYNHILTSTTATAAIPVQGSGLFSFRTSLWNGTIATNQEFNWATQGNNVSKTSSLILFYRNNQTTTQTDTVIMNITDGINNNLQTSMLINANISVYATDNASQKMCLNITQAGVVNAFKC